MRLTNKLALAALSFVVAPSHAEETNPYVSRDFLVDVAIVSHVPGGKIESYGWHGSGMATSGSRLGLGVRIDDKHPSVNFHPYAEENRLLLEVDVTPDSFGLQFEPFDLTTLRPLAIDLGTDESGRVFQANVTPRVRITDSTPQAFDAKGMRLHHWTFPDCTILLNDSRYVGRIHCSSSPVGFFDVSSTARVEFSLLEVKEWEPWGTLTNGKLTLSHPDSGTSLQVAGVRNGRESLTLPGGPYRVWVNWSESETTVEQHREQLQVLRDKYADEDPVKYAWPITNLDRMLDREPGPWAFSSGIRGYQKGETVVGQ